MKGKAALQGNENKYSIRAAQTQHCLLCCVCFLYQPSALPLLCACLYQAHLKQTATICLNWDKPECNQACWAAVSRCAAHTYWYLKSACSFIRLMNLVISSFLYQCPFLSWNEAGWRPGEVNLKDHTLAPSETRTAGYGVFIGASYILASVVLSQRSGSAVLRELVVC